MPLYESVFIARQDVTPAQVDALSETFEKIIADQGGSVPKKESWGLRTMAYKIKKNRKGHYVLMNIDAPADAIHEMERQMRLNEDVLRTLTTRVDELEEGPSAVLRAKERGDDRGRGGGRGGDRDGRHDRERTPVRDSKPAAEKTEADDKTKKTEAAKDKPAAEAKTEKTKADDKTKKTEAAKDDTPKESADKVKDGVKDEPKDEAPAADDAGGDKGDDK